MAKKTKSIEVPEKDARKLLTQFGFSNAKGATTKKLTSMLKKLPDHIESLDDEDDLDVSKPMQKLANKICAAVAKDHNIQIESEEDDDDEDEAPKKKGKGKKGKEAKGKKAKKAKKANGETSLKTQQSHALNEVLAKGPISVSDLFKKASKKVEMSEKRVEGHVNWMVDKGRAKMKKGKVVLTD